MYAPIGSKDRGFDFILSSTFSIVNTVLIQENADPFLKTINQIFIKNSIPINSKNRLINQKNWFKSWMMHVLKKNQNLQLINHQYNRSNRKRLIIKKLLLNWQKGEERNV